jgi:CheY-like chemotaxis protein
LIEDDRDDQDTFLQALSELKNVMLVEIVNNGREALEKLKNSRVLPDFIFMDVNMPVMNGMECLTEIDKYPNLREVPVVMLSTSSDQKAEAFKLGAKAFIKKTSNDSDLCHEMELIFNKNFRLAN